MSVARRINTSKHLDGVFSSARDWVIDDVRFPNELNWIRNEGGVILQTNREKLKQELDRTHVSETALDNMFPDLHLDNTGTLAYLHNQIDEFISVQRGLNE